MVLLVSLLMLSACVSNSYNNIEKSQTDQALQEAYRQVGLPRIHNFFEKRMAKQILELRDNPQLITYAYIVNLDGKFVYLGRAIGFGLPYSVQYTNPERVETYRSGITLPQPDPNGLYMPEGLSATWLMLINKEGKPEVIYVEPEIVVTQSKLPKRLCAEWSLPDDY